MAKLSDLTPEELTDLFDDFVQDPPVFFSSKRDMLEGFMLFDSHAQERPTGAMSIEDQLGAIRVVISANEKADAALSADISELRSLPSHTDRDVDEYGCLLQQSTYMGSAMSLIVSSLYVSFLETLMTIFFQKLGANYGPLLRQVNPSYERWRKEEQNHFDFKRNGKLGKLGQALDLAPNIGLHLDASSVDVINVLRNYRNRMVHNSLEWPVDELRKFEIMLKGRPTDWFGIATKDNEPTFFFVSRPFIDAVETAIQRIIEDMASFLYSLMYPIASR